MTGFIILCAILVPWLIFGEVLNLVWWYAPGWADTIGAVAMIGAFLVNVGTFRWLEGINPPSR